MINFTIKQLKYFQALSQFGHFGHAADACSISQPALSMQIKELEESLGTPLFERNARHVRLTSFGEEIAHRVRDILRSIDELSDMARTKQDQLSGRLRIGVIPTIAPYLLPHLLETLQAAYPELDIHIRETLTPKLVSELHEGKIDTAILALPVAEPAFSEIELFSEEFVLVRPQSQSQEAVPDTHSLGQERLLLLEEGHCLRDQALSFCNIAASGPRDGLDGTSLSTLVQLVGAGIGMTLLPEMAVTVETRAANVCVDQLDAPRPQRTIGIIWRKSNPLWPQLMQIASTVKSSVAPIAE